MVVTLVVLMGNETAGQWVVLLAAQTDVMSAETKAGQWVVTTAVARAGSMASYWAVRKVWK